MPLLSTVFAQESVTLGTPTGLNTFTVTGLIGWAVTVIIVVAGLIFFFMLIIGGLRWILSGGDKAATESARGQITAALIGLVVVFSAWAIATLLQNVFGINILNISIPALNS